MNKLIKGKVKSNEALSRHTTFRIGGAVDKWVEPKDIEDLRGIIKLKDKFKRPIHIIGSGSNLLVSKKRIKGTAICLSSPSFKYINREDVHVKAGAGASLSALLNFCMRNSLTGLEFCTGIPGTIGGALFMNAGLGPKGAKKSIGSFVERITLMDRSGRIKIIKKKDLRFGYRRSALKNFIILEVVLALKKARKPYIRKLHKAAVKKRCKVTKPSAGCVFKNPYDGFISAGKLIDLAGLKGKRIGTAQISRKHANYIVNLGNAKFADVKKLISIVRKKIKEEFNVELELEIKIWK